MARYCVINGDPSNRFGDIVSHPKNEGRLHRENANQVVYTDRNLRIKSNSVEYRLSLIRLRQLDCKKSDKFRKIASDS